MTENNKCGHGFANGLTYLLIGGGIGAVLALLFAPKSGNELRGDIADVSRRGYDATLEKANELKRQSAETVRSVREKAEAAYEFAADKFATGREAVSDAVSSAAGSVIDGVERMQSEPDFPAKQPGNGRKGANIV